VNLSHNFLTVSRTRACLLVVAVLAGVLLAGCASKRGPSKDEQAKARWNEARARVLLNLAGEQYARGNLKDARKTTTDGLRMSNQVGGLYILQAKLDIEDGQLQSAAGALRIAKQLEPNNPEPYYYSGIVAERWQRPDEALAEYRAASQRRPTELAYLLAAAEALVSLDRSEEAAEMLESKLVFFESSAPIRDMLAQIYQEMGRMTEAAELYRQASLLAPDDPTLRERHALALVEAREWRQATDVLERLVARPEHSEQASLHIALAECRMQIGNTPAARAAFMRATRLDPKSAAAWLGVGKAALAEGDIEKAEFALRQAEALNLTGRTAADAALLRGYLHLKQNQVQAAAKSFQSAAQLAPDDPMPLVMLGFCQQKIGRADMARGYYTRALELDPQESLARQLLDGLARTDRDPLP
jgi:tetratricopeptide (TPR) repeat protein